MSTEWFDKRPGETVYQSQDDPTMLLVDDPVHPIPDWVRVPDDTGYGGQYRCLALVPGVCPLPGHGEPCRHYILDGPVSCAECVVDGKFVWYRRKPPGDNLSPPNG